MNHVSRILPFGVVRPLATSQLFVVIATKLNDSWLLVSVVDSRIVILLEF